MNDRTLIKEKHPPPHPDSSCPPAPSEEDSMPIKVSVEEVSRAICSFPCGSAGGPDGLRPQHLKDMTSTSAEGGGPLLLSGSTNCINQFGAEGQDPSSCPAFLFWRILSSPGQERQWCETNCVGWSLRRLAAKSAGNCMCHGNYEGLSSTTPAWLRNPTWIRGSCPCCPYLSTKYSK